MLGRLFRVSVFGESHGRGVGVLVEGCPPGLKVDTEEVNRELAKRRPGRSNVSGRLETDRVDILCGVYRGYTTGAPLAMFIANVDIDSSFYEENRYLPRPSHADYVAWIKYKGFNDNRGGGIFSGRLTAGLVAAGSIAKALLRTYGIEPVSYVVKIGNIEAASLSDVSRKAVEASPVRCPDPEASRRMVELLERITGECDSVGGVVETRVDNVPVGLGNPPIDTLEGDLAKAIFAIPGVKGIEFGAGFKLGEMRGSEANDEWFVYKGLVTARSNCSGGVNGGLSNGMPIMFRTVFRPTPTIGMPQETVDLNRLKPTVIRGWGRHDPCIAVRGSVVVEAVTSIVLADHLLRWMAWREIT